MTAGGDPARTLHLHLPPGMLRLAAEGRALLVARLREALGPEGWALDLRDLSEAEVALAPGRPGWSLLDRIEPAGPRMLCLRMAYLAPFWRIEATNERWRFDVALARFDAAAIDPAEAGRFAGRWREAAAPGPAPTRGGFAFAPLQGRLLARRSFQAMSPLAMLESALAADPRPIRATLHPREAYAPDEIAALGALAAREPRLTVGTGGSEALLAACDHVVAQNSSLAFRGFFLGKRAVLHAGCDFHHVAGSVPRDGPALAWGALQEPEPPFDRYLWWFLARHAINVRRADAPARLLDRLRRHGMPL